MLDYSDLIKYLGRTYLVSGNRGSRACGRSVHDSTSRSAGHRWASLLLLPFLSKVAWPFALVLGTSTSARRMAIFLPYRYACIFYGLGLAVRCAGQRNPHQSANVHHLVALQVLAESRQSLISHLQPANKWTRSPPPSWGQVHANLGLGPPWTSEVRALSTGTERGKVRPSYLGASPCQVALPASAAAITQARRYCPL
jgi:hypothetical protein